jgi:lipid-binding SYLF domain-containing protein
MLTGRIGTGLVMSKLTDGNWSAPSAIGCSGVGWGFQVKFLLPFKKLVFREMNLNHKKHTHT